MFRTFWRNEIGLMLAQGAKLSKGVLEGVKLFFSYEYEVFTCKAMTVVVFPEL